MSEPASRPEEHDRPSGHPADKPWPPRLREYPPDHPARRDEESKVAFNEDWAREDFGDAFVDGLIKRQMWRGEQTFAGDWWLLALLIRCAEITTAQDPDANDTKRYFVWNSVRDYMKVLGICCHLERAHLGRVHLEHVQLGRVHLEHSFLYKAHLKHADLGAARLEHASLGSADLYHVDLEGSHLEYANLWQAQLEHANLKTAHLDHANLTEANLGHAHLLEANLEHANLLSANLEHARLMFAKLEHANLLVANLEHANLWEAHLGQAKLTEAVFTGAEVRGSTGLRFDANRARDIHIEGNAPDPWSVLRRKYTGPMFFVHFGLLLAYVLPYIGKVLALTAAGHVNRMLGHASDRIPHSWTANIEEVSAIGVLIGLEKGWLVPTMGAVLLVYNGLRALLTIRIGQLRDAEERSGITPTLAEYMGTQGLRDEGGGRIAIELFKGFIRWWLQGQFNRIGRGWSDFYAGLEALGLWRLHLLLRVLFLIVIVYFLCHTVYWAATTTVPIVRVESPAQPAAGATP